MTEPFFFHIFLNLDRIGLDGASRPIHLVVCFEYHVQLNSSIETNNYRGWRCALMNRIVNVTSGKPHKQ